MLALIMRTKRGRRTWRKRKERHHGEDGCDNDGKSKEKEEEGDDEGQEDNDDDDECDDDPGDHDDGDAHGHEKPKLTLLQFERRCSDQRNTHSFAQDGRLSHGVGFRGLGVHQFGVAGCRGGG